MSPCRTWGQKGIIGDNSIDTHQYGLRAPAKLMYIASTLRSGHPTSLRWIRQRKFAVYALCPFQYNPCLSRACESEERRIQYLGRFRAHPSDNLYPCRLQALYSLSVYMGSWVLGGYDNLGNFGVNYGSSAWPRLTLMAAGLQGDIQRGALRITARATAVSQSVYLCVRPAIDLMPSLANDLPLLSDHTTYCRIGFNRADPLARKSQGALHKLFILRLHGFSL